MFAHKIKCNHVFALAFQYGDTPLHTSARYGHAGVTRILISAKSRVSDQNKVFTLSTALERAFQGIFMIFDLIFYAEWRHRAAHSRGNGAQETHENPARGGLR